MVTKMSGNYVVTDTSGQMITLSEQTAFEIMEALEREYHREDVEEYLNDQGITATERDIEGILDDYEDALSDDGSWRDILENVVDDYSFDNDEEEEDE